MRLRSHLDPLLTSRFFSLKNIASSPITNTNPSITFPHPESETSLLAFWSRKTDRYAFQQGVFDLIDNILTWCKSNQLCIAVYQDNIASFKHKFEKKPTQPADIFPLYDSGIKYLIEINIGLHTSSVSVANKQTIIGNLFSDLNKCGPGVLSPLLDASLLLNTNLNSQFLYFRKQLAEEIALQAIRQHALTILEEIPGSETHWVKYILDQYHSELGLLNSEDNYATEQYGVFPIIHDTFIQNIVNTLSVTWLIERIIKHSETWQYLSTLSPTDIKPEDIDNFNRWLTSYGYKANRFNFHDLIRETEDGELTWHPQRLSLLTHELLFCLMDIGYVKRRTIVYLWEINANTAETIALCTPYKNSLELAYLEDKNQQIPLSMYGGNISDEERITQIILLIEPIMPEVTSIANFLQIQSFSELNRLVTLRSLLKHIASLRERYPFLSQAAIQALLDNQHYAYHWVDILLDKAFAISAEKANQLLTDVNTHSLLMDFFSLISIIEKMPDKLKKYYFDLAYEQIDQSTALVQALQSFYSIHSLIPTGMTDEIFEEGIRIIQHILDKDLSIAEFEQLTLSPEKLTLMLEILDIDLNAYTNTFNYASFFNHESEEEQVIKLIRNQLLDLTTDTLDINSLSPSTKLKLKSPLQQYETVFLSELPQKQPH